jgi:hypothetical protein
MLRGSDEGFPVLRLRHGFSILMRRYWSSSRGKLTDWRASIKIQKVEQFQIESPERNLPGFAFWMGQFLIELPWPGFTPGIVEVRCAFQCRGMLRVRMV